MLFKSLGVTLLALSFASPALARNKRIRKASFNDNEATMTRTTSAQGSSELARTKQHVSASLELLGVATPLGLGSGLRLGYFIRPNSMLELSLASATQEKKTDDDFSTSGSYSFDSYEADRVAKSSFVELSFKRFATNSFYWAVGPADRHTRADLVAYQNSYATDDEETTKVASIDAHDMGLSAKIGNQWQWDHFTLGCDWIGLYMPLVTLNKKTSEEPTAATDSPGYKRARNEFYKDVEDMHAQGVRFYMGASF